LAWYELFYRYKSRKHLNWEPDGDVRDWNRWHPNFIFNELGEGRSFSVFVEEVVDRFPDYYTLPSVDSVGKQESLTEDLIKALHRMNLDFDESLVRDAAPVIASRGDRKQIDWDPDLRGRVVQVEQVAIRRFGYEL